MDRRHFMHWLTGAGLTLSHAPKLVFADDPQTHDARAASTSIRRALPTPQQRAWQELELGLFVHFAPNTWQDLESDDLSTPLSRINPRQLDTDQWARTAASLGARYLVFVAKHQGGFCMWQTRTTDYSIRGTPWKDGKGDVLAEVAASCKRHGLGLGVYVCPRDDHFGAATGGICKTPEMQARYDAMYREQLREVLSGYGDLVEIWFDGSTVTPVADLLSRYQPNAMIFQGPQATIRWVGNEDGFAPYPCWNGIAANDARSGTATALDGDPDGSEWMPCEVDVSIRRPDWFWSTKNEHRVLTVDQLLSIYYRSVGRGAQLLLNIPATREGLLPATDSNRAAAFGEELRRRFATPLATTSGRGPAVLLTLPGRTRVDTIVLQEQIEWGERIRAWRVEAQVDGRWRTVASGSAVGQKCIRPIRPITASGLRLVLLDSVEEPRIRKFAAYDTGVPPPADWSAPSRIWSPNLVGRWSGDRFEVDLSQRVHVAGQYALLFRAESGKVEALRDVRFELGDATDPALIKHSRLKSNELLLDLTGIDRRMRVTGSIAGSDAGSILLQRR
ncbi:MAG TPA: alpha-L-fucosidase [Tepidisphaeraceae bacterium]|nr:alpha-L-fucosidase [Tepidisphaeraceae bacterium]